MSYNFKRHNVYTRNFQMALQMNTRLHHGSISQNVEQPILNSVDRVAPLRMGARQAALGS